VTVGQGGVLTAADVAPGILIDSSTVSAEVSASVRAEAAKRGTPSCSPRRSAGIEGGRRRKLTLAVSGPRPPSSGGVLLGELGQGVTYVGEDEAARLVKICHNVFLGVVIQSLTEITVLAEKGGWTVRRSWSSSTTR